MNSTEFNEHVGNFVESITGGITSIFGATQEVPPLGAIMCLPEDREDVGIAVVNDLEKLFANEAGKAIAAQKMREACKELNALVCVMISEAWMVVKESKKDVTDKDGNFIAPSEHPDKVEVVIANFETHNMTMIKKWSIMRDKDVPYLVLDESSKISGWRDKDQTKGTLTGIITEQHVNIVEDATLVN